MRFFKHILGIILFTSTLINPTYAQKVNHHGGTGGGGSCTGSFCGKTVGQGLVLASGSIATAAPTRLVQTANVTIAATDLAGYIPLGGTNARNIIIPNTAGVLDAVNMSVCFGVENTGVWTIVNNSGQPLTGNSASALPQYANGCITVAPDLSLHFGGYIPAGGSGTVTSVAATVPTEFAIAGSPIVNSGTLAITSNTQSANTTWSGPTTGAAATPGFRALVDKDIPVTGVYRMLFQGGINGNQLQALTKFYPMMGYTSSAPNETGNTFPQSDAGKWVFLGCACRSSQCPASGQTITFSMRANNATPGTTSVCTITGIGADTTGVISGAAMTVTAGQYTDIQSVTSATTGNVTASWYGGFSSQ